MNLWKMFTVVEQPTVPKGKLIPYFTLYEDSRQFYMAQDTIQNT